MPVTILIEESQLVELVQKQPLWLTNCSLNYGRSSLDFCECICERIITINRIPWMMLKMLTDSGIIQGW